MFSLSDPLFWLGYVWYAAAVFFAYFIPGSVLLSSLRLGNWYRIPLSVITGMTFFALQGMVFGFAGMRWMTYPYLLVFLGIYLLRKWDAWKLGSRVKPDPADGKIVLDRVSILVIVVGTLIQLSTIWFTGVEYKGSIHFCCGDTNDNLWFAAITKELTVRFPPDHPGLSGYPLHNYHYWSNLVVAETARVFRLPYFTLQFQYWTVLLAVLAPWLLVGIAGMAKLSISYRRWLLVFFYFGSDLVWLLLLALRRSAMFSMSSLEDGVGFFANLPRASAVIVFFAGILLFLRWLRTRDKPSMFVLAVLFGTLVGFKIYVGIFVYAGLIAAAAYSLLRKRDWSITVLGMLTAVVAAAVYLPVNAGAGGMYWTGLWRFRDFIVQPALGLIRLELARTIFAHDGKWLHASLYDILYAVLYIGTIFGLKLLGLFQTKRTMKRFPAEFHALFIAGLVSCGILGFFFQQSVGSSNTFNFLVCVFLFLSFYAALSVSDWTDRLGRGKGILLGAALLILLLPRIVVKTVSNIGQTFGGETNFTAPVASGVRFVKENTPEDAVILVDRHAFSFDRSGPEFYAPMDRQMYFSGEDFMKHFQVDPKTVKKRFDRVEAIVHNPNIITVAQSLKTSPVDYLVLEDKPYYGATVSAVFLDLVYRDSAVQVVKVNRNLIPMSVFGKDATSAGLYRAADVQ